jgi:putative nucleotidyltransferase with HDIG domain
MATTDGDTAMLARDRERAWALLTEFTKSESLLGHAKAVEASVRWYAQQAADRGELDAGDVDLWGVAALLHDFDWEVHPTLDEHPTKGAEILRERGYPEELVRAILAHAPHTGVVPETPLERTLFACDELSGFCVAVARMRPEGFVGMTPKSVTKKLKTPAFAAGVNRDEVRKGAELLGLELNAHIANVVEALTPLGPELLA